LYICSNTLINDNTLKAKKIQDSENKDYMLRVRMSIEDKNRLKKISKVLKVSDSETIRLLIESKSKELKMQKNIFE
jgi:hypothetical protein